MTWTLSDSGTTSALTIGTETTLATDTNNGTFVFEFDADNMVNGDLLEARIYTISLSGGSLVQAWRAPYAHIQINKHKISMPVASDQSIKCTLKQIGGTLSISSVTGAIPAGTVVTGLTSGATAIVNPLGGGNVAGSSTIVQMLSGVFTNGETVQSSSGNSFVLSAAPTGRTFAWKMLRI
jgi:hypothetical protein